MIAPVVMLPVQVEGQQGIETGGTEEQCAPHLADFMAMLQVTVAVAVLQLELAVVAEQFVGRGDIDVISIKRNAAQAAVGPAALPVDVTGVPGGRNFISSI